MENTHGAIHIEDTGGAEGEDIKLETFHACSLSLSLSLALALSLSRYLLMPCHVMPPHILGSHPVRVTGSHSFSHLAIIVYVIP